MEKYKKLNKILQNCGTNTVEPFDTQILEMVNELIEEVEILTHNLKVCQNFSDRGFDYSVELTNKLQSKLNKIDEVLYNDNALKEIQQILEE